MPESWWLLVVVGGVGSGGSGMLKQDQVQFFLISNIGLNFCLSLVKPQY